MAPWALLADEALAPVPAGHDYLYATIATAAGTVLVAAVGGFFAWLGKRKLDRIGASASSAAADAAEARNQTANTHETNLRDDLDEKFKAVHDKLDAQAAATAEVKDEQREQRRDIGGVRSEIRAVRDDASKLRAQVDGNAAAQRLQHDALAKRLDEQAGRLDEHLRPEA